MARQAAVPLVLAVLLACAAAARAAEEAAISASSSSSSPDTGAAGPSKKHVDEAQVEVSSLLMGLMAKKNKHGKHDIPRKSYYHHHRTPHSTLDQLKQCLLRPSIQRFDLADEATWERAIEGVIHCLEEYLDGCDVCDPILANFVPVPQELLLMVINHLVKDKNLELATKVYNIMLIKSPETNCAEKLTSVSVTLLKIAGKVEGLANSMEILNEEILSQWLLTGRDPLCGCAAELPVALFASTALYCPGPSSGHTGSLNFPGGPIEACSPAPTGSQYQNNPGVTVTGALLVNLMLQNHATTKDPKLQQFAADWAFSMVRWGLAASQTSSYSNCLSTLDTTWLAATPTTSGTMQLVGPPPNSITVTKPLPLSSDGAKLLCRTIAALSETGAANFQSSVLHQGNLNVWVAIALNAAQPTTDASVRADLCAFKNAVWTLVDTTVKPPCVYNLAYLPVLVRHRRHHHHHKRPSYSDDGYGGIPEYPSTRYNSGRRLRHDEDEDEAYGEESYGSEADGYDEQIIGSVPADNHDRYGCVTRAEVSAPVCLNPLPESWLPKRPVVATPSPPTYYTDFDAPAVEALCAA